MIVLICVQGHSLWKSALTFATELEHVQSLVPHRKIMPCTRERLMINLAVSFRNLSMRMESVIQSILAFRERPTIWIRPRIVVCCQYPFRSQVEVTGSEMGPGVQSNFDSSLNMVPQGKGVPA